MFSPNDREGSESYLDWLESQGLDPRCEKGALVPRSGDSVQPQAAKPDLESAARRALNYLTDWHCDNQRDVIEALRAALGERQ